VLACALVAWALVSLVARTFARPDQGARHSIMFGRSASWTVCCFQPGAAVPGLPGAQAVLSHSVPLAVFKLAIPVLLSLLVIRMGVKVLQATFKDTPAIRLLERSISWIAWLAMVLWVSGLLPLVHGRT
jgi:hypothetical protein